MKSKYHVGVEVYDNGCVVTIKKNGAILGTKVFEDKGEKEIPWKNWVNETINKDKLNSDG